MTRPPPPTGLPEVTGYDAGSDGVRPLLVWRFPVPLLAITTAVLGGGVGLREWVINAEVDLHYGSLQPEDDLQAMAAAQGLDPRRGVGLLTAASVRDYHAADISGTQAVATVGLTHPVLAADPDPSPKATVAGTINIVAFVPVPLAPGALANTLVTVTEAKAQALQDAGFAATGTASDATVVCCPPPAAASPVESFAGPRSRWGHALALATHAAVHRGAATWRVRNRGG